MSGIARTAAEAAKRASEVLGVASEEVRNEALFAMAAALRAERAFILEANERDMNAAREAGTKEGLLDRLMLNDARVEAMAASLESLAALPDPTGAVLEERTLYNDLKLTRVSVPLGVVAMVYEARPNVTVDAAGICVKSGNACVLRSGSLAIHSAVALGEVLQGALSQVGLPKDCVVVIDSTDRSVTDELFLLRDLVDVLIPRGGAGLIRHCVEHSLIPVIETGTGNCHIYIHESADLDKAYPIVLNAKTQRVGVCNACESVLVDRSIARACLPELLRQLAAAKVRIHGDEVVGEVAAELDIPVEAATEEDWGTEYLDYEISIKCVEGLEEAIAHINRFGTKHSEAILAEDETAAHAFARRVDAAGSVYQCLPLVSPMAASSGLGPRSASLPRSFTCAGRSHSKHSPPTNTSSKAKVRCARNERYLRSLRYARARRSCQDVSPWHHGRDVRSYSHGASGLR